VVVVALAVTLAGSMFEANRQIEIHQLQSQLLQEQSSYAEQVGSITNLSAPSQIATKAGALHLVDPTSVTQVPSTSLTARLPLPKFSGYAPATSRTIR
jgi:cell division protein FtsL